MGIRELKTKPAMEEAVSRWLHFWNGELLGRPVALFNVTRKDACRPRSPHLTRYRNAVSGKWEEQLELIDSWLDRTCFPGDMIPMFSPDFGPDQWAAFMGAALRFSEESDSTNWVMPVVRDWKQSLPLRLDMRNPTFRGVLGYAGFLELRGKDKFFVANIDAHSNADALCALRGTERFMMDFYDCPELLRLAMRDITLTYGPVHKAVARAGGMGGRAGGCKGGIWHPESFQIIQSDIICMLSPVHFREFIMPALEEEFLWHKGAMFHLDGPGALKHLDDILSIPGYWILQFQPGEGAKPNWQWVEVLKKAQDAGKAVQVFGPGLGIDALKKLKGILDPSRVVYMPDAEEEGHALEILDWLEKNT